MRYHLHTRDTWTTKISHEYFVRYHWHRTKNISLTNFVRYLDYHWLSLFINDYHWLSLIIIDYLDYIWKFEKGDPLTHSLTTWNQEAKLWILSWQAGPQTPPSWDTKTIFHAVLINFDNWWDITSTPPQPHRHVIFSCQTRENLHSFAN